MHLISSSVILTYYILYYTVCVPYTYLWIQRDCACLRGRRCSKAEYYCCLSTSCFTGLTYVNNLFTVLNIPTYITYIILNNIVLTNVYNIYIRHLFIVYTSFKDRLCNISRFKLCDVLSNLICYICRYMLLCFPLINIQ